MPFQLAATSVLFVYVDNSNIWIEGQRLQAVKLGLASDPADAQRRSIQAPWFYDFGRLYDLVCPADSKIGRSILFGSRPPADDTLWNRARREGFEVKVFDRNASNKEKQVDVSLSTTMMEDSYEYMKSIRGDVAVLVGGDGDFLPTMRSLQKRGVSRELREVADDFLELDPHFDTLTRHRVT